MPEITIVIPVGPYHLELAERAVQSAEAQTVPCDVFVIEDKARKGPSWARNRGLEKTETPFVVFLDADDWIDPPFVERCLEVWKPGRYVYTDFWVDDEIMTAPGAPWCNNGEWHCITTLLPTEAANRIGGFDDLPGAEDTEFYWALTHEQHLCGIHLAEVLFHYSGDGQRAHRFKDSAEHDATMYKIVERYARFMGCCGDNKPSSDNLSAEGMPGDVLTRAIWQGNRQQRGSVTGRLYPRGGNGKLMMVDPRDQAARPNLWQLVQAQIDMPNYRAKPAPPVGDLMPNGHVVARTNNLGDVVQALFPGAKPPQVDVRNVERVQVQPDTKTVSDLARRSYGE